MKMYVKYEQMHIQVYVVMLSVELEYTHFYFCQESKLASVPGYHPFPLENQPGKMLEVREQSMDLRIQLRNIKLWE